MGEKNIRRGTVGWPPAAGRAGRSVVGELRRNLPLALLAMLFLVLPLYRTAALEDSFITPKLMLVIALGLAAGVALIFNTGAESGARSPRPCAGSGLAFAALVAWHAAAVAWAPAQGLAMSSLAYWLSFVALYHVIRLNVARVANLAILWGAATVAAVITAVWTTGEDATRGTLSGMVMARLPDWRGYLAAGLGNSGHIAGYIGYCLPAAATWFLLRRRPSVVGIVVFIIMFAALVVTWSVGSTGSALVASLIWVAVAARTRLRRVFQWRGLILLAVLGLAVTAFYLLPHPLNPHRHGLWAEAFASERWKEGGPTRLAIYLTTWHMIRHNPLLGIGAGNFTHAYVQQIVPGVIADPRLRQYAGAFTNDAHNEYLHVWCETGLPGLLLLAAVVILFFVEIRQILRRATLHVAAVAVAAGGCMTALLLDAIMTFPFRLPAHMAMLTLALASVAALPRDRFACATRTHRLRLHVVALVLLPLVVAGAIHTRRVAAECLFKRARTTAETSFVVPGHGPYSPWAAAEFLFAEASNLLALGREAEARSRLDRLAILCREPLLVQARRLMEQALRWDSTYTNASSRLGALLLMAGDYENARLWLIATLRNLQAPEVHERLGFAYYLDQTADPASRTRAVKSAHDHWRLVAARRPLMQEYMEALIRATDGRDD
jgi:O-antigen ligase